MISDIVSQIIHSPDFKEMEAWTRRFYKANEIIVKVGEDGQSLYYVENGMVRVTSFVKLENDKQMQTGISDLHPGSIFGESSINPCHKRTATVLAVSDCSLIEVNGHCLISFLEIHPEIGFKFYKALYEICVKRLNDVNKRVSSLMAWGLKAHQIDKYL